MLPEASVKKALPLFHANLLFALTMALVILAGSTFQWVNLSWGMVATEVFIIALPTILILRLQHVPLKEGLRLKPLPALTGVLCVLLGITLYFFSTLIQGVVTLVTKLPEPLFEPGDVPTAGLEMVAFYGALTILAPLCEEMLFRGAFQGAYENRKSAGIAITITALLFAFYHLRLIGLPALIPLAFALSYVVWRTGSIYAGMLLHFGANGTAALQTIFYFVGGKNVPIELACLMLPAPLLAIVILCVINWKHPGIKPEPPVEQPPAAPPAAVKPWLATYWPLLVGGFLYVGVAGLTLFNSLALRSAPSTEIQYGIPVMRSQMQDHYIINNEGGEPVGVMDCSLKPASSRIVLDCTRTIRAFEYKSVIGYFKDTDHTDSISATWDAQTMDLLTFSEEKKYEDGTLYRYAVNAGRLETDDPAGKQELELPQDILVEFEWAWHTALLKANSWQSYRVPFADLMTWNDDLNKSTPLVRDKILEVGPDETLELLQNDLTVRKLTLAGQSTWYDRKDTLVGIPRPVKFDDGMFIYILTK